MTHCDFFVSCNHTGTVYIGDIRFLFLKYLKRGSFEEGFVCLHNLTDQRYLCCRKPTVLQLKALCTLILFVDTVT